MKKMFDKTLPKKCEYCVFASPIGDERDMVCKKRGIVLRDDLCRKYKYDPLKREPKKTTDFKQLLPRRFSAVKKLHIKKQRTEQ